jgi:D-alanyl-D-alanine carboxypeptidase (penicillin-binding protein 5/6)
MTHKHKHKKYLLLIVAMGLICLLAMVTLALLPGSLNHPSDSDIVLNTYSPFDIDSIEASSVFIYDVSSGEVVYEKNADEVRPLASITKVMTAFTALDFYDDSSIITIDKRALSSEGDTGLLLNESWKFKNLLNFTMLTSSNDGATALAIKSKKNDLLDSTDPEALAAIASSTEEQFVARMNEKAADLGLSSLRFNNETGLDLSPLVSGAYGSAKDVGLLMSSIIKDHPEILAVTKYDDHYFTSQNGIAHLARNTDTVVNKIPGILASKTGYTDLAGGNLAIAFDIEIGHPIVVVVLGSSYEGRFNDVVALASSTRAFYFQH